MAKCLLILYILFVLPGVFCFPKSAPKLDYETTTQNIDSSSESELSEEQLENQKVIKPESSTKHDVKLNPEPQKPLPPLNSSTVDPKDKRNDEIEESTDEGSEEYEGSEDQNGSHLKEEVKNLTSKPGLQLVTLLKPISTLHPQIEEVPKMEQIPKIEVIDIKGNNDAIKMPDPTWEGADDEGEIEEAVDEVEDEVEHESEEENLSSSEFTGVSGKGHPRKEDLIEGEDGISLTILEHSQIVIDILKSQNILRQILNPGLEESAKKYFNLNNLEKSVISYIHNMKEKDAEKLGDMLEDASQCDHDLAKEFTSGAQRKTIARYLSATPKSRKAVNEVILKGLMPHIQTQKISFDEGIKDTLAESLEVYEDKPSFLNKEKEKITHVLSLEDKLKAILEEKLKDAGDGDEEGVDITELDCEGIDCIPVPEGRRMKEKASKGSHFDRLVEKCIGNKGNKEKMAKSCGRLEAAMKRTHGMRRATAKRNNQESMPQIPKTLGELMYMNGMDYLELPHYRTTEVNFGIDRVVNRIKGAQSQYRNLGYPKGANPDLAKRRRISPSSMTPKKASYRSAPTVEETASSSEDIILHSRRSAGPQTSKKPIYPGSFPGAKFLPEFSRRGLGISNLEIPVPQKSKCQMTYSKSKKVPCSRRSSKFDSFQEIPFKEFFKRTKSPQKTTLSPEAVLRQMTSKFKDILHSSKPEKAQKTTEKLEEILDDYYEDYFGSKTPKNPERVETKEEDEDIIFPPRKKKVLPPKKVEEESEEHIFSKLIAKKPTDKSIWKKISKSEEKSSEEIISYKKKKHTPQVVPQDEDSSEERPKPKKVGKKKSFDSSEVSGDGETGAVIFLDDEYIKKLALHTLNSHGNNFKKIIKNGDNCDDENDTKGNRRRKKHGRK